jgi:2-C-methyl-D-erythritol 4-phosphate cytidylyltransferase
MVERLSLSAIIVAAGSSTRVGFDKLFARIAGRPVIQYSIEAFEQTPCVNEIIVVGRENMVGALSKLIAAAAIKKVRVIVRGGERRQDSVAAGLDAISESSEFVAVHDAARPLITPDEIERVFSAAEKHGGAVLATPVTDTLKLASAEGIICGSIDRENVFAMQTPQIFARQLLVRAYERVTSESRHITDEAAAVQMSGATVAIVSAQEPNMKVTFAADLPVAEFILRQRALSQVKI